MDTSWRRTSATIIIIFACDISRLPYALFKMETEEEGLILYRIDMSSFINNKNIYLFQILCSTRRNHVQIMFLMFLICFT